jgi:hypothetical protein
MAPARAEEVRAVSYRDPRTSRYADDDVVEVDHSARERHDASRVHDELTDHDHGHDGYGDRGQVVATERHVPGSGRAAARERFGGMHVGAQLVGMLTALAMTILVAGLLGAAIGGIAFQTGIDERLNATAEEVSLASVIGGIVVLAIAFLVGGWAAGRMSRYDGGRNGLMTAVWFLLLGVILAGLGLWIGAEYNVAAQVALLPDWFGTWFDGQDVATGAVVSGVVAIFVILAAGFLGGKLGERFHRRADEVIALHASCDLVADEHRTATVDRRTVTEDQRLR